MREATQRSLDALSQGINAELAAYVFYKKAGDKITDREFVSLMERLAGEEKDHYWTLEAEYDSLVRSEKWVTYNDILRKEGLPEVPEEMAEIHRRRLAELVRTDDPRKILDMAIELEEHARDFYQSQIGKAGDPLADNMFSFLAKFEQSHVNVLTNWKKRKP